MDIFNHWLATKGQAIDLVTCEKAQLNNLLRHFYGSVRNTKGELYALKSYHAIRSGLNRYINGPPIDRSLCLTRDPEFTSANRVFMSISEVLKSNADSEDDKPVIPYADMEKIVSSSAMDTERPRGLLNKVWFDIQCHFGRRTKVGNRALRSDSFVQRVDKNGVQYYTMQSCNTDAASGEEREQGEDCGSRYMYEKPGDSRCPVASLEKYLDRLPRNAAAFYLRPYVEEPLPEMAWYQNVAVGLKDLGTMLPRICQEAHTSRCFQNASLQRTVNQRVELLAKGGRMAWLKKCPLCHKNDSALAWHLLRAHDIHNVQERGLLVGLASDNVKCLKEPCPIPACRHVDKNLVQHLETHWEVSWSDRQELLAQLKRSVTIRMLAELRATNPKPPLTTNLDLEAPQAHTANPSRAEEPCGKAEELEETRAVPQKGRPPLKRELDVMTISKVRKTRFKASISTEKQPQVVVVLEEDPSSPPPDQRMLPDHIRSPNQLLAEDQYHAPGGVRRNGKANVRSAKPMEEEEEESLPPGTSIPGGDGALLLQEPPSSHSEPLSEEDVLMMEASEGKDATQTIAKTPLPVCMPTKQLRIQLTPINISHFLMN
ncbi:hypothetical protein CRUP_013361 [Coryphaenoides rupestris]|nr:hypothetical protein CRUP_013361 [Coryphaenoides rupestris]